MRVLITGADGFVGRHLIGRLLRERVPGAPPIERLVSLDVAPRRVSLDSRVKQVTGTLGDPRVVNEALGGGLDCIFHLACVPGRAAEDDYERGLEANFTGSLALLEGLRRGSRRTHPPVRVIFASSVAVFGSPLPERVDDDTLPSPAMSYASQKLMTECLIQEYTRRHWIDGLALRLSGILARPAGSVANLSAFFNDVLHAAKDGRPFTLPLRPELASWLMSVECCVDNLLHAAQLAPETLPTRRAWTLPALRVSMRELVEALAVRYGAKTRELIGCVPNTALEAVFGQPPLFTAMAERLGFRHDGDTGRLIERAMAAA